MTLTPPEIWLDTSGESGVELPRDGSDAETGVALGNLRVAWGRRTTRDRVDPTVFTFDFRDPSGDWTRTEFYVGRRVLIPGVFDGRITDVEATPDASVGQVVRITAADFAAEWARMYIGDTPYDAELAYERANNIRNATDLNWPTPPIIWPFAGTTYPPDEHDIYNPEVRPRDVDRRTFRELLDEIADTIDSVVMTGGGNRIIFRPNEFHVAAGDADLALDASCIRLDGDYVQTIADVATRIAVGYFQDAIDDTRDATLYDESAAARSLYGENTLSIRTERLDTSFAPGVNAFADHVLARADEPHWRLPSVRTDERLMDDDDAMQELLNAIRKYEPSGGETTMLIRDMPDSVPVPDSGGSTPGDLYLRLLGGTYAHDGNRWSVTLHTARMIRV